jgi:RNA polymerase-associated protein CTR9
MERAKEFYDRACKLAPDLGPARFGLAQTQIWDSNHDVAEGELRLVVKKSPSATDAHAALGLLMVKNGKDKKAGFSHLRKAIDLDPLNPDLVLLEAYALQQEESDYTASLDRYRKATQLMQKQGKPIPWVVLTNMGVLCYETKKFDDAADSYQKAFKALELEENYVADEAKLEEEVDFIRNSDNHMFWKYVSSGATAEFLSSDESGLSWKLDKEITSLKVGDHVRAGEEFLSVVTSIDGLSIKLKQKYVPMPVKTDPNEESNETNDESKDEEVKEVKLSLYVKRGNERLSNLSAVSIAFNFARLHEAAGRIVASVELHKAIVKRHPSYVNSYLRLACISRDCGSLENCSEWLKCACAVAPGNPEVLILVGNLHLSLCDWHPAQRVFNQLLEQKIPKVDAYSMLCLGNIYFDNLKTPGRYVKHLGHATDYYRRILNKDNANAYAANGIGTVLAEKGDLIRSKEIFNKVREISGDTIPDALLNLGHIYLALSKHNEALQMYQSYMDRTNTAGAQITSKNKDEDNASVLLYIAFAYYDWAKQTEAFKNTKSAPADGRYKKCIEYIEQAIEKSKKENVVVRYNLCIVKLSAANCILRKASRMIPRTAKEVQEALHGLEESLPKVQTMIQWKKEKKKVPISTAVMQKFVTNCRQNIENAQTTLNEELKKEAEDNQKRENQRLEALTKLKEKEIEELERKEREAKEQENRDRKARAKMQKVDMLVQNWEFENKLKDDDVKKKPKKEKMVKPQADDAMFDESSDEEDGGANNQISKQNTADSNEDEVMKVDQDNSAQPTDKDLFGDDDDSDEEVFDGDIKKDEAPVEGKAEVTKQDLFGDSDDSDDEKEPAPKRSNDDVENKETGGSSKKRRIEDEEAEAELE